MGTDIRKVPLTWKHPRKDDGQYLELKGRFPPTPKRKESFGFMFYSSVSDTPLSDEIFTDRRAMKKHWLYFSRAREASRQNYYATQRPEDIEGELDQWFDMEDVPKSKHEPITQDEMPRCIALDWEDRQTYAKARQKYKDGHGVSDDDMDAMFEMFDAWLIDESE